MKFAYIVTIHNSEQHLVHVLQGIKNVKSETSEVFCCIDGCTDRSEEIVDSFGFNKIFTNNVRETATITNALKTIKGFDLYLITQDDVVLKDGDTEEHIKEVYSKIPNIGVLGFRHGANIEVDALINGKHASEEDLICNEFQPEMNVEGLKEGYVTQRQIVYKSPICLSREIVQALGGYDERFEPIAHDDTEYCIRAMRLGFSNYVCALNLRQPVEWGGTRRFSKTHEDNFEFHMKHFNLIRELYPKELVWLGKVKPLLDKIKIWN